MSLSKRPPHHDFTLVRVGQNSALSRLGYFVCWLVLALVTVITTWLLSP